MKQNPDCLSCEPLLKQCRHILRAHNAGVLEGDEVYVNLMVTLIHAADDDRKFGTKSQECWKFCLELFPKLVVRKFNSWLEREVVPFDYMPSPHGFMTDTRNSAEVEARRRELRPLLVALHDLARQ